MSGFGNVNGSTLGTVMSADNVSFDGTSFGGVVTQNGQLLIGANSSPHIRVGHITSSDSSLLVSNLSGSIDLKVNSSPSPSPASTISLYDDFIMDTNCGFGSVILGTQNFCVSAYSWEYYDGVRGAPWLNGSSGDASHPGILTNTANGSTNPNHDNTLLMGGKNQPGFILGGGALSISWCINIVNLSDVTNGYDLFVGMYDTRSFSNGVFFQYTDSTNSGNWVLTAYASGATSTNSSTAVGTGWQTLRIDINAAGTNAEFFVNDISIGTVASGFPTGAIKPVISIQRSSGTVAANSLQVDAMWLTQTLTTSR
jgi:hypothetical protein